MENNPKQLFPSDLKEPDFILLDELKHNDLLPFIRAAYKVRNKSYYFHNLMNSLFWDV